MKEMFKRAKIVLILVTLIIDLLTFLVTYRFMRINYLFPGLIFYIVFWLVPFVFITMFIMAKLNFEYRHPKVLTRTYTVIAFFLLFYLPKLIFIVFHIINEVVNLLVLFTVKLYDIIFTNSLLFEPFSFISYAGLCVAFLSIVLICYGILVGRFHYKLENVTLKFKELPAAFNGFKIVHISDIHLGSWVGKEKMMKKAINLINNLKPDVIFFTGDMVNNFSEEALGWEPVLKKLKSRLGNYSILGNHDYGDYWDWKSKYEKQTNFNMLLDIQKKMGFRLLRNESETISINGQKIGLIGVENWGKPPFHQYGDLMKAQSGLNDVPFKILLSHDPSHWEEEVINKTDIDLTLSGHTHAMQLGISIKNFKWSPVKYMYKQWAGLYRKNKQYLYVNRGLGFIAFPGRIGMRPEITVISLRNDYLK